LLWFSSSLFLETLIFLVFWFGQKL